MDGICGEWMLDGVRLFVPEDHRALQACGERVSCAASCILRGFAGDIRKLGLRFDIWGNAIYNDNDKRCLRASSTANDQGLYWFRRGSGSWRSHP